MDENLWILAICAVLILLLCAWVYWDDGHKGSEHNSRFNDPDWYHGGKQVRYALRWWSLGRMYNIPDLDRDTGEFLFDIIKEAGMKAELLHGTTVIRTTGG
jgi:hypothetical protein